MSVPLTRCPAAFASKAMLPISVPQIPKICIRNGNPYCGLRGKIFKVRSSEITSIKNASIAPCKTLIVAARDRIDPTIVSHQPSSTHATASISSRRVPASTSSIMALVTIIGNRMIELVPKIADIVGTNLFVTCLRLNRPNTATAATPEPMKIVTAPENRFKSGRDVMIEKPLIKK